MKPRMRFRDGNWECSGLGFAWTSRDAVKAYQLWSAITLWDNQRKIRVYGMSQQ